MEWKESFQGFTYSGACHPSSIHGTRRHYSCGPLFLLHDTLTNNMGKNDKKGADKGGKGKADKGKDAKDSGGKSKGAQSINVRHILVSFTQVFTN